MRSVSSILHKISLAIILCALIYVLSGCTFSQPGETVAEGHRRHIRNLRIDNQEMNSDIDKLLLLEKPSRLSEKRIP